MIEASLRYFDDTPAPLERKSLMESNYISAGINFVPAIYRAYERTLEEAGKESPNLLTGRGYYPNNMNWNVLGYFKDNFPSYMAEDETRRPYFRLSDNIRVYFKKLDHRFRPNNIPTEHVKSLNNCQGMLFGEPLTILYAGWRIRKDKYWDGLAGIYLVEMENMYQYKWVSDLSEFNDRFGTNPLVTVITSPVTGDGGVVVLPRTGDEELEQTGTE